jgi:hypothetical protein
MITWAIHVTLSTFNILAVIQQTLKQAILGQSLKMAQIFAPVQRWVIGKVASVREYI